MQEREREMTIVTLSGAAANVALAAAKLVAGMLGKSSAMMADAIHSLSDLVSDVIVLVMVKVSSKGRDKGHDYGHGKFETLATAAVSLILLVVGARLMQDGVSKILSVVHGTMIPVPGRIALWAALVSIAVKEILYQWTARVGRRCKSPAIVSNAWHHRTDALSSIGSAIGIAAAIMFGGRWAVMDPVVCCMISIFIIIIAVKMALPALNELTEASLPDDIEEEMQEIIRSVPGVENVHAMKTRSIGPNYIVESHIVVRPDMSVADAHAITAVAEERLRARFGQKTQISLHVEPDVEAE